jgi:two-component system alkaline phosphatase synthesis response regulator PhoP
MQCGVCKKSVMAKQRVLVVEDEEDIAELVQYNLNKERYEVLVASSGEAGLDMARRERPDLILLDIMLPGMDGLEVCRALHADPETAQIPIVMVTAKGEEADIVTGLELGADDYVTKPFSPKVLIARLRSVLRRRATPAPKDEERIHIHDIDIHPGRHEVTVAGESVQLTNSEFRILHFLARRPGWVFTRYQIVDGIRGENYPVTERAIDVQIVGLRKKLGPASHYIETVRGVGYRMKE